MAMPTITALLAYGYAKEGQAESAAKTLEIAMAYGRKYTAQSPYADYPSIQDKGFLSDIGKVLEPHGLPSNWKDMVNIRRCSGIRLGHNQNQAGKYFWIIRCML